MVEDKINADFVFPHRHSLHESPKLQEYSLGSLYLEKWDGFSAFILFYYYFNK